MSATSLKLLLARSDPLRMALCAWLEATGSGRRAAHARCARFRQSRSWRPGTGGEYPRGERRASDAPAPTQIEKAIAEATAIDRTRMGERSSQSRRRSSGATRLERAERLALVALTHPLESLPGQKSWTEIPFGTRHAASRNDLPWDPTRKVEIPGAGVFIQGHIDRLDLSGDGSRARVIDYKTGKPKAKMAEIVIDGGGELQRCLYAFAVKTLLGQNVEIDAALLYPLATEGDQALFPLQDVDATLEQLADAIALARRNIEAGLALPGDRRRRRLQRFRVRAPG